MPRKGTNAQVWDAAGAASAAIGGEAFYDRLLEVLAFVVETDLLALMRYSSFGAPDFVLPREIPAEVETPYSAGFYALDPFHHYWQTVGRPAVKSLRQLAAVDFWQGRYALEFLGGAHISDEIAIFLPPSGDASPTLILDRTNGPFTPAELTGVEQVFPLLAGLHHAHLKAIASRGMISPAVEKPPDMVDRGGGLGASRGLRDPIEVPLSRAPCATPDNWLAPLTQREKQIVSLTLEGHPIAGIAKKLGVGRGTIKNHRLRLYQKLDITTERELFLVHMRHLEGARA